MKNNKKVLWARFHQNIYVPGAGELGNTLPSSNKTLDNLSMELTHTESIFLSFSFRGLKINALIPSANVISMTLDPSTDESHLKVVAVNGKTNTGV